MLNKETCEQCRSQFSYNGHGKAVSWEMDVLSDEKRWESGEVYCPWDFNIGIQSITQSPPKKCPYKLEHTVLGQKNVK